MEIKRATKKDVKEIYELYQSLVGTPECLWDEYYPGIKDVENDIENGIVYIAIEKDKIIAAIAAGKDEELEEIPYWDSKAKSPCNLSRLGVKRELQNQGIANQLVRFVENDLMKNGFDSIHFIASKTNPSTLALYKRLGWSCYM